MSVSYDVTSTLRSQMKHHEPIVLVYDARGNGGGDISPTITGDHQNRITDYTAIVVEEKDEDIQCDEVSVSITCCGESSGGQRGACTGIKPKPCDD